MSLMPQSGEGLPQWFRRVLSGMVTSVKTTGNVTAQINGNTLSISVPNVVQAKPFFAKITGSSGTGYTFIEQWATDATTFGDLPNGRTDNAGANLLYEVNGVQGIPDNSIVFVTPTRPSTNGPTVYFFSASTAGGASVFPVKVEKTAGDPFPATFVYTVRTLPWNGTSGGEVLGTNVPPSRPRPNISMIAQGGSVGYGIAFYDGDTLILWDAGEVIDTDACPEEA
jgi:hypothetical protein